MHSDKIKHKGLTIAVKIDTTPQDPRGHCNLGVLSCHCNYYMLANEADVDFLHMNSMDEVKKHLMDSFDIACIIPVYAYIHGDITLSCSPFSCQFDSGQVGYIFMTQKTADDNKLTDELEMAKILQQEIAIYCCYVQGNAYGYEISEPVNGQELDSCWGFYSYNDCLEQAKLQADFFAECIKDNAEELQQVKNELVLLTAEVSKLLNQKVKLLGKYTALCSNLPAKKKGNHEITH